MAFLLSYNFCHVTEQSSNKSSNQVDLLEPVDLILCLKINLWQFETGVREDLKRFFFMPEQKVHVKVAESENKVQLQEWKTAFDSRDKYVKNGLHEIIEKLKKQPRNIDDLKAKQAERKPGLESIEWWSVLPSVLLLNAAMLYTWFSNLKSIIFTNVSTFFQEWLKQRFT